MEYCSHIWGGSPRFHELGLLGRVQKRVIPLVGSGHSSDLQALSHRRDVASLNLFYKYYYGKCSSELVDLIPLKRFSVRSTHFSEQVHRHTVNSLLCRTTFYQSSFFPRTAALWNSLTNECFPPDYDLTAFKGRVNKFLLLMCSGGFFWGGARGHGPGPRAFHAQKGPRTPPPPNAFVRMSKSIR